MLTQLLDETSGAGILSCPAGSGKTTSLYACLRELAARSRGERSLATLEDPIEAAVPGVAQSQVNLAAGLTLESGLRALLRQDPEVIAIGEIRDRSTAEIALQAALTGHLTLTTFHAGSACEVIGRLLDMGIEPYAIRSGLRAVVAQRLVRRLCPACATPSDRPDDLLGLPVERAARTRPGVGRRHDVLVAEHGRADQLRRPHHRQYGPRQDTGQPVDRSVRAQFAGQGRASSSRLRRRFLEPPSGRGQLSLRRRLGPVLEPEDRHGSKTPVFG